MAEIRVTGVGVDTTVSVPDGATIDVVLAEAGIEDAESVNVEVNGTPVESPSSTQAEPGSAVSATPRNASLG